MFSHPVATALAGTSAPGAVDALLALSADAIAEVRAAAARSLVLHAQDARVKPRLAELARDAHPEVRAAAAGQPAPAGEHR